MQYAQWQVMCFHNRFGLPVPGRPAVPTPAMRARAVALVHEELQEFAAASAIGDLAGVADALADLLYVVYGAAVVYGIDMEPIFQEVHRTNMLKAGDGARVDGKVPKPADWRPPDILRLLKKQGAVL